MQTLATWVNLLLIAWLCAVAAIVGYKLLTGEISRAGLLAERADGPAVPERVQALAGIAAAAAYYLFLGATQPADAGTMPPVPDFLLWGFGGSQLIYLFSKVSHRSGVT